MTYIANKLKHRIAIQKATQTANDEGGYDYGYETLITVWGGVKPIKRGQYIRGVQAKVDDTHDFIFRKVALIELNKGFTDAFGDGFNVIEDLNDLKTEFFLFVYKWSATKGKRFRIKSIINHEEDDEFYKVYAQEFEERGTGHPE